MAESAVSRGQVRSALVSRLWRSARVVFAATLLTTCGTDTAIGPGIPAQSSVDLAGLLRAGGPIPIPIDTVLVELRRLTDSSVAFSQQVDVARFQQQGNDLILSIALALRTTPEQFYLYAEARGGGVVYYTVRSTVTAAAGQSTQSPSLIPTYVGPGSTADSVVLTLVPSSVAPGDSALATAVVFDNDAPVAGAPVGIVPADTVTVRRREVGVNSVWLVAPATGSGSTPVTATTPTGLIAFGQFDWAASAPVSYVTVLPLAQSLAPTQTLQYSAIPYDALDNILTGLPVSWTSSNLAAATVSPTGLVTAVAVGSSTITATIGGAAGTSLLTVATAGSGPGSVVAASATSQGVTVNQLVAALPAVLVSDSASQPLAGVAVTFAVTAGGGSITGGTATTNAAGLATLGSWRAGQTAGANTVTATVTGLPPVAFTATGAPTAVLSLAKISGDAQSDTAGRTLPLPLVAEARDSFNNVVPAAVVTWTTTDGSLTPLVDTTDALGLTQASWTLGFAVPNPTATATLGTHTAVFNAATIFLTPSILLTWQNTPPGVGVGLAAQVRIQLTQPAPVGGVTINLVSANSSLFTVAQATRFIAAGQTVDSVAVNGIAVGTANLDATGSGYTAGALSVTVEDRSISVPVTLSIAYGITSPALPIQLATNAPAGGVTLNVVSSNPAAVGVQAPTVTIPAGQKTANVTLIGVLPGTATVSVSGAGYITANTAVTTAASLVGIPASITIDASFGTTLTVQFTSSGSAIAAPAPGVLVSLIPADSGCVAAVSPKLIPTGLATITSAISYGGSTTLPCSTQLILSAPNVTPDTVPVTVNPTPGITLYPATVGSGLQESIYGYLGATNHGGVNVTLTSSDPALLLLAPNAT
ncbi:MAG: Ig-like domain-containing protein, partial [Gemmatimonadota bacterium]|nr:Ig-like domain-containing protein [Gemmatimonadota bacterium]